MTTRIIALIALLALLATPPRTTGRTRRFNSIVKIKIFALHKRESQKRVPCLCLSLSLRLSVSQSLTTKKILRTQIFKNPHILVFTKARTNNHAVRLSLPPSLLSFRRRSRCSFRSARTSQSFAFLSFAWYRARRCLFTRIFIFIFFFRCFLRARGVAVPKFLTLSRSLFHHHAVKSSTYKPASAVTKSGQSSGRCARGFFSFFRSL